MDNSTGITVIIGPHPILTQTQRVNNQHCWSLNTCGIVNGYLIGPYFCDIPRMGKFIFLSCRINWTFTRGCYLAIWQKIWWQQDGASPYSHRIVTKYLNNIFHEIDSEVWIYSMMSAVSWFNFEWFSFVELHKNIVYKIPPTSVGNMKNRITNVCCSILQNILISTVESFEKRSRLQENGSPFKHLING